MNTWYFPAESGDIRLEAHDGGTRVSVVNPTPRELWAIRRLLTLARKRGWSSGEDSLQLNCTVEAAGRALLGDRSRVPPGVVSAVKYADGRVEATLDGDPLPQAEPEPDKAPAGAELVPQESAQRPQAVVARATMPRPTLCCPTPWPGPLDRASQVLQQFCTDAEWAEWMQEGMIHVRGGYTGHTYRVVHRHHPLARAQGKITWDETSDHVVHCHMSVLPPPEEVLSVVLVLKHGEDWIRNPSGYFGPGTRFAHPAGLGAREGIASAAGIMQVGIWAQLLGMSPLPA